MMNVFVLEDDFAQQSRIESIVCSLMERHHIQTKKFEVFGKPYQLIRAVEEKGAHQLFFLDIEIRADDKKGLEVAQQIRDIDPFAIIVFVTTHSEYMPLAFRYQVSALDFIDKELAPTEFEARIETALLYANGKNSRTVAEDSFYYKSRYAQVQVPFADILYIETSPHPHRVILHTEKDRLEFTGNLADILKQEKRLLQCHRSYLVNPNNVVKVDRQMKVLYFRNGSNCYVARNRMELVHNAIRDLRR